MTILTSNLNDVWHHAMWPSEPGRQGLGCPARRAFPELADILPGPGAERLRSRPDQPRRQRKPYAPTVARIGCYLSPDRYNTSAIARIRRVDPNGRVGTYGPRHQ